MAKTQAVKGRSLGSTIRATGKIIGGSDVANFTLVYIDGSDDYTPGASQVIVYPVVEVGRNPSCVVKFGKNFPTVSRKHAAFVQENGRVKIRHLSSTNSTYVRQPSGNVVTLQSEGQEHDLENATEIQFSSDGPKVRFLTTETRTSSMGFTQKWNAMAKQALRPYRNAVATLALLLIGVSGFSAYWINQQSGQIDDLRGELVIAKDEATRIEKNLTEEMEKGDAADKRRIGALSKQLKEAKRDVEVLSQKVNSPPIPPISNPPTNPAPPITTTVSNSLSLSNLRPIYDDIYFLRVKTLEVAAPQAGQRIEDHIFKNAKWSGTAFLDTRGRLITARHVIQGWRFNVCDESDPESLAATINTLESTGATVNVVFEAISPSGDRMEFPIRNFKFSDELDVSTFCNIPVKDKKGKTTGKTTIQVKACPSSGYKSDWAWIQTNKKGSIVSEDALSTSLKAGEEIVVLGYSFGQYIQGDNKLRPIRSTSEIAQDDPVEGVINVTNKGWEVGSSGGPAFVEKNGRVYAVGIVSNHKGSIGSLVPVGNMY